MFELDIYPLIFDGKRLNFKWLVLITRKKKPARGMKKLWEIRTITTQDSAAWAVQLKTAGYFLQLCQKTVSSFSLSSYELIVDILRADWSAISCREDIFTKHILQVKFNLYFVSKISDNSIFVSSLLPFLIYSNHKWGDQSKLDQAFIRWWIKAETHVNFSFSSFFHLSYK